MRKLIIMRGAPGAGKSMLAAELGLAEHTLSMDGIRLLLEAPELNSRGGRSISQKQNERVAALFKKIAHERMARGETLVLDATFPNRGEIVALAKDAETMGYQVMVMDFSGMPAALVRERNAGRVDFRRVGEQGMNEILERMTPLDPISGVRILPWAADDSHVAVLRSFVEDCRVDLSKSEQLMFIGDLQGCMAPLAGKGGLLENGFADDCHYIFVGDIVDRGPENGAVVRWLIENALDRDNVSFLFGNHEMHLLRWAHGLQAVSKEFDERTAPSLKAAGVKREDVARLIAKCRDGLAVHWRGQNILVTHAGLPGVPDHLHLVSGRQTSHGAGYWSDPVDSQFEQNAPEGWVQVHGHRNFHCRPILASARSINLEGGVEFGGCLRAARLDSAGWHPIMIRNPSFLPWRDRLPRAVEVEVIPKWMKQDRQIQLSPESLASMLEHPGVKQRVADSRPHIASLNFSKRAFFDKQWDQVTVRARGMFYDMNTGEIAARGYDKFFNVGERDDTTVGALSENLRFPVSMYIKENGFLGNLGYDEASGELLIASKSTIDSCYARWFGDILTAKIGPEGLEQLRRYLRDMDACMTFEVIDPANDPHMIEYPEAKVVLLDMFHRGEKAQKVDHDSLVKIGERFKLETKRRAFTLDSPEALGGLMRRINGDLSYRVSGEDIEGFVLEDADGFMTKIKLGHYAFWKRMRATKNSVAKLLTEGRADEAAVRAVRDPHPLAVAFGQWCCTQSPERLDADIITLRKAFLAEAKPDPELLKTPWYEYPEQQAGRDAKPAGRRPAA